jgi:hypothetical protein
MRKTIVSIFVLIILAIAVSAQQTTSFSYQGKLNSSSVAANGSYDFKFELFSVISGGTSIGNITANGVSVSNGIFTVQLDFGANTFDGTDRYLDISVKLSSETTYTTLTPRQKIASVPYATKAIKSDNADSLGGITANNYLQKNGDASQLTNINGASITNNTVNAAALASDAFPNQQNLKLLGSLRWDLLGQRVAVGLFPIGVAFDGANIWTANANTSDLTKIRASDGSVLGTFPVGIGPLGIAFDGANIWVTNRVDNTVSKMRAGDGLVLGTFVGFSSPRGIAFDGANMWVANYNGNAVMKLRASDGVLQTVLAVGTNPSAVAFDGENIWVANNGSGNVTKIRASNASVLGTFNVGVGPSGIAFDGANIWTANFNNSNVTKLRAFDGANLGAFALGSQPVGVIFDGANIWVSSNNNTVTRLRASDGVVLDTLAVGTDPRGLAFDGVNIWVANALSNNVTKLPVFRQP